MKKCSHYTLFTTKNANILQKLQRYFIIFIDDCSNYSFVYLMKNKSEAIDMFKIFITEIENQFNRKIKRFHTDRGQEYESAVFVDLYKSLGIIHETTASHSPEMNGKAERKNRTLAELTVAVLLSSGAASFWWGEILLTVCYVLNRIPNSKTKISPYIILKTRRPNVLYFRTGGCLAYVRIPKNWLVEHMNVFFLGMLLIVRPIDFMI